MRSMKILVISYHYVPEENPRVFRWSSIVSHWLSCGHDVSVITAADDKHDRKIQDSLHVISVPENMIGRIRYKLSKKNSFRAEVSDFEEQRPLNPSIMSKWVKELYSFVIKRLQWPDFAWTWILNARKAVLLHLEDHSDIDVVISVSHPFSSHVVGSIVKKKYPKVKWIMDIGDPFSFLSESQPNNFLIYNRLNEFIERKYFSLADFVSVTTQETKSEYVKLFPESELKIKVIPPVLSSKARKIFGVGLEKSQSNRKVLKLVYLGTLYSGIRHPQKMLKMLADVRTLMNIDFEIHFFGPTNDVDISQLTNSYTYFHESVSHDVALKLMMDADMLINIGNSTKFQLPSKLVEYVCSGTPVLNIISRIDDSSHTFLSNYQMCKTICLTSKIKNDIIREVADYIKISSTRNFKQEDTYLRKYSVQNISKQYELMFY